MVHDSSKISEYLNSLIQSQQLGPQVVYQTALPPQPAMWSKTAQPLTAQSRQILQALRIKRLYRHQALAIDNIRQKQHVVVATPTASGKTLVYNLPAIEKFQTNRESRALYIFPLKALAQDQLRTFEQMAAHLDSTRPTAAIYDGDLSAWRRKRIRETPPNVILTNPEMIHLSLLAHHPKWASFWSHLEIVVVDEVHTYRGIMGSHVAQVFRRLRRICEYYGAAPTYVFSSATIENPAQLIKQLTGLSVNTIANSGAPRGKRNIVFLNPVTGPAQAAILLLKAALHRNLRTIVYTQSRKLTELIALWASSRSGSYAKRISAYRAGFLPEERREIEGRLSNGDLLAVISTSALELGIDIGDLDLCLLVGYPGTVVSTWQRGGRVGRSGQDSAVVLIAAQDALDQFFMRNPRDFVRRKPEAAVANPSNPDIMAKHLVCAAAELALKADEPLLDEENARETLIRLEKSGDLLRSADGKEIYSLRKSPHRDVDLRGTGNRFKIIRSGSEENIGEIDDFRAFRETHPGAIYLHRGDTFRVDTLDLGTGMIHVSPAKVDYYTRVRAHKLTEILDVFEQKPVWGATAYTGKIKVTDQVIEYETWRIHAKTLLNRTPLDLPPQIFETEGLWFQIPNDIQRGSDARQLDFLGGIHAMEHAAIGIFPLLVLVDRNDLGGLATPYHPQTGSAVVFIYDGVAGGAGLSRKAFERAQDLLEYTLKTIEQCACESGCPSCVHSPKCGSGNRPIDKPAAIFILNQLRNTTVLSPKRSEPSVAPDRQNEGGHRRRQQLGLITNDLESEWNDTHFGVLDLETQRSAQEVGGWHRANLMGISCAVLYDSRQDAFLEFLENQIPRLFEHLQRLDLVVGFNIKRFDYQVLEGYSGFDPQRLPTLDILEDVHRYLGFRLSLAHLARVTLGKKKTADGLQALQWWKQGRIEEIIAYCRVDVRITRDLFLFGKAHGYLLFNNRANQRLRIPVDW